MIPSLEEVILGVVSLETKLNHLPTSEFPVDGNMDWDSNENISDGSDSDSITELLRSWTKWLVIVTVIVNIPSEHSNGQLCSTISSYWSCAASEIMQLESNFSLLMILSLNKIPL